MMIEKYTSSLAANQALFEDIKSVLDRAITLGRTPKVLLSGGSSPKFLYNMLGKEFTKEKSLKIGLVDERFVPVNHEQSNEQMIRGCFSESIEIVGMVKDDEDYQHNLDLIQKEYADFHSDLDIVLLGMGEDGHFASIFPNDILSSQAITDDVKLIRNTTAPNFPTQRITCNLELLAGAKMIYLLLFGQNKFELLSEQDTTLPIQYILNKRPDIKIYYSNDK